MTSDQGVMKRLREKIESIVFAGLSPSGQKPQVSAAPVADTAWGRLRARIDGWISGGPAPTDPLYLSNRTTSQKMKSWSVVAVPLLILIGGVGLTLSKFLSPPESQPARELTTDEVASKMLPSLKDIKIEQTHDIEVVEVRIEKGAVIRMAGTVRNRTNHPVSSADITCDLTDAGGSQVGAVTAHVEAIPAAGTKDFSMPVTQTQAAFVLVREILTK
jgi:hypothetical protein